MRILTLCSTILLFNLNACQVGRVDFEGGKSGFAEWTPVEALVDNDSIKGKILVAMDTVWFRPDFDTSGQVEKFPLGVLSEQGGFAISSVPSRPAEIEVCDIRNVSYGHFQTKEGYIMEFRACCYNSPLCRTRMLHFLPESREILLIASFGCVTCAFNWN